MSSQLFEIMRTQVLLCARNNMVTPAISYAWSKRIYPYFEESASHMEFEEYFSLTSDFMKSVIDYVDEHWLKNSPITFYQIENNFGGRENRFAIIRTLRYAYLDDRFDADLWRQLTVNGSGPSESQHLAREFDFNIDVTF